MKLRRDASAILLAVFLDLLGFGMLIADIQLRAEHLTPKGAPKGLVIGGLLASTFVVQTLVSPRWGRLSDRIGRKPVAIACTLFSAAAMFVYGFADSIAIILFSRILAGFGAANVAVAQAFVSDQVETVGVTASLGRIGAVISAGLVIGPPLGGFASTLAKSFLGEHGLPPQFLVGCVAGTASLVGAAFLLVGLPNVVPTSIQKPGSRPAVRLSLLSQFPSLRPLIAIVTIAWFSLAMLEGTFARLIEHLFGYGQLQFGFIFGYESLLGIVVQGTLLAFLVNRFRQVPLIRAAYVAQGVGLAMNPGAALIVGVVPPLITLYTASTVYAVGSAIANPSINALCSQKVPTERQGELFGLLQGTRSLGFVLGPVIGGVLFDQNPTAPYLLAGAVCLLAAVLI